MLLIYSRLFSQRLLRHFFSFIFIAFLCFIGCLFINGQPIKTNELCGGIAQLARASALQAEGHRFKPDYLHHFIFSLSSMAERSAVNRNVIGSSPIGRAMVS